MIPPNDCATYVSTSAVRKPRLSPTLAAKGGRAEHLLSSEDFEDFRHGSLRKEEGPKKRERREKKREREREKD